MENSTAKTKTLTVKNKRLSQVNPNVAGIDIGAKSIFFVRGLPMEPS